VGHDATDQASEATVPLIYLLNGAGIRVRYSNQGTPTLDYSGPEGVRSFSGAAIEHTFVPGGTLVTVAMPEGESLGVYLPQPSAADTPTSFETTGLRLGAAGHRALALHGTARVVAA
jgi:hypothetical protein